MTAAAAAVAAAVAAAPIPPHMVAHLENPLTADPCVFFEADAAVVTATHCLDWLVRPAAGAAPAAASLPTTLMRGILPVPCPNQQCPPARHCCFR